MDKLDSKFERMLDRFDSRTQELANEINDKRSGYSEVIQTMLSGIQETLIKVNQQGVQQHDISDNMLKVSISQKHTSRIQEKLLEKLDIHAIECKERNGVLLNQYRDLGA